MVSKMGNTITTWRLRNKNCQNTKVFDLTGRYKLCKILYIHDGDTVTVAVKHRLKVWKINVRMFGINSPELRPVEGTPNRSQIVLKAARAREALREKILNKNVMIEFHQQDRHGRWLGTIYTTTTFNKKKENINDFMTTNSYAVRYFEDIQVVGPTDVQFDPVTSSKNSEDIMGTA